MSRGKLYSTLDQKQLRRLYREGFLPESVYRTFLVESRPSASDWRLWFQKLLLVLGIALVLVGTFFFFVWNWPAMTAAAKFTFLETALCASVLAALLYERLHPKGRIFLFVASILTGVLLTACAQVYQTGIYAWELFAGWSLLIFGWVAVSRFILLWALWLALIHLSALLFWTQVARPDYGLSFSAVALSLAVMDMLFLLLREGGWSRGLEWMQERWSRLLLLATALFLLSVPIMEVLLIRGGSLVQKLCVLAWFLLAGGGYIGYRHLYPDLIALGLIVFSGGLFLSALTARLLIAGQGEEGDLFIFALVLLVITAVSALWLRSLAGGDRRKGAGT